MYSDRKDDYKKLEESLKTKLLIYITGDRPGMETQIHQEVLEYFINHLDNFGNKVDKISLFLYTRGGDTLAAWSLVNLIRQFCKNFEVIIPSKAHSSGTLICLGANTIIMTKQATLGPIDPSLNSPLNPQNPEAPQNPLARVPVSVESINSFFELAKKELGIKKERQLTDIMIKLADKIHPIVLGNVYRSRSQIQMLAKKLLKLQLTDKSKINKITNFLCSDSGSHDYSIYRNEAKDELSLNIIEPDDNLYKIIKRIYDNIKKEMQFNIPFNFNATTGSGNERDYSARRALIESIEGRTDVYVSEGKLIKYTREIQIQPDMPPIQRSMVEDNRLYEGWKHEN